MKIFITIYFAFALMFLIFKTKVFDSSSLFLVRSLFPNWKFFDQFGVLPRLFFKIKQDHQDWGPWQEFHPPSKLKWSEFFLNPNKNLVLSEQSILQQLVGDIETLPVDQVEKSTSFQLLELIVRTRMEELFPSCSEFQFQIRAIDFSVQNPVENAEALLTSGEYVVETKASI